MELKSIKKILVINLGGIGDVLLSLPALKALRKFYPQAEIYGLFNYRSCDLVKGLPYFNKIVIFDIEYGGLIFFKNIFTSFKILLILRREHFDLAINMRTIVSEKSAEKMKFIFNIINPKIKAGRDTDGKGCFFDIKIPETLIGKKYEMEYDIETIKALGTDVSDKNIDFQIVEETANKINELLKKEGIFAEDVLIGIHPGGMPTRRWPVENFSKAAIEINNIFKCKFIITGGKDDLYLADELKKMAGLKMIDMTGRLDIKELGALIKRCNVYISNDTGPMHMAAVLKTPLIAIFGPGDLTRFDPRNISGKAIVLYTKKECSPCEKTTCDSMECLKEISAGEVVSAAKLLLHSDLLN
ncbi:MAG: glycosyltransferase family 9 protein [bacterium]